MAKRRGRECDFCGELICDNVWFYLSIPFGMQLKRVNEIWDSKRRLDMCRACQSKMKEWVVGKLNETECDDEDEDE